MPSRAPTGCRHPGCPALLATPGYCERHRGWVHRDYGRARQGFDTEIGFYRSAAWRRCREAFLRVYPLCRPCLKAGRSVEARVVDHVVPIKNGGARFDWDNLQALCVACHNRKTASETRR